MATEITLAARPVARRIEEKEVGASRLRGDRWSRSESVFKRSKESFGMHGAEFNGRQTGGFLQEKIIGHATVGNDELRCTGGADEITTPFKKTAGGSGCSRPGGLTLAARQFPEEKPQKCEAGRDAVRSLQSREVKFSRWNPQDPLP